MKSIGRDIKLVDKLMTAENFLISFVDKNISSLTPV
jgi:hypothetical protein